MTTEARKNGSYWTGGALKPLEERITYSNTSTPKNSKNEVLATVESFIHNCQLQDTALYEAILGVRQFYDFFGTAIKNDQVKPENRIFMGTQFPDARQEPGKSTTVQLNIGEVVEYSKPGGKFEGLHAKAFIVFINSLWCESFRKEIAEMLSIPTGLGQKKLEKRIVCYLMDDICLIRNCIVHANSVLDGDRVKHIKMLPKISNWERMNQIAEIKGELLIKEQMIHSLMEQINAIQIRVENSDVRYSD